MKHYRSSIPKTARERVTATFVDNPKKYQAEYVLNGEIVGIRYFHGTGDVEVERPLKNGLTHGTMYWSDTPGRISFAEPYSNGLPHGVARQWSDDGKLIGTYTMKRGTGIDLWRCERSGRKGSYYLSEARYLKDGKWHGFEWWLKESRKSLWQERHFREDELHGNERRWNWNGRLDRGYPRYWVSGKRVAKRQYLRECARDPALPTFREKDNRPQRKFPPEVAAQLGGAAAAPARGRAG